MNSNVSLRVGGALLALAAMPAVLPATASAASSGYWGCTSSALRVTLAAGSPVEPLISDQGAQGCLTNSVGVASLGASIGHVAGADAARAWTINNSAAAPANQAPEADATIANVKVTDTATPLISLPGTVTSRAYATCTSGVTALNATSTTVPIKIGNQTIQTDRPLTETLAGVGTLTGAVLAIKPGEQIRTANSLTVRALHVTLKLGSAQLLDLVLAESTVSFTNGTGGPCANHTAGSGAGGASGSSSGTSGSSHGASNGTYGGGTRGSSSRYGFGFDSHGMRIEATRTVKHGSWTRVRIRCSARVTRSCTETLTVYRLMGNLRPKKIGTRKVTVRRGQSIVVSVRTTPYPRYPVFAQLS
jgi:hypothetical protein